MREISKRASLIVSSVLLSTSLLAVPATAGWDEGVAAFKAGNLPTAQKEFQELIEQSPDGWQGHYMLGLVYQAQKNTRQATDHLRKAYDLNPNDLSIKSALGKAYYSSKRYGDTAKLLGSVDPSSMPVANRTAFYQLRGDSRLRSGNERGAYDDFGQLAKLKPQDAQVQYNYGLVALKAGQVDAAIRGLDQAVRLDGSDAAKKKAYAQALVKRGRETSDRQVKKTSYLKAAELASSVVAANASYDNLMLKLSAELGAGKYNDAAATGQQASAKKPGDWLAYYYTGQAFTSANRFAQAEGPLRDALAKASPSDQKLVWKQLGFSYEKQKKYADSVQAYQNAGDSASVARVRKNEETASFNRQVETENEQIEKMREEAEQLERELKALEGGGG